MTSMASSLAASRYRRGSTWWLTSCAGWCCCLAAALAADAPASVVLDGEEVTSSFLNDLQSIREELRIIKEEQTQLRLRLDQCQCATDSEASLASLGSDSVGSGSLDNATLLSRRTDEEFVGSLLRVDVSNMAWLKEVLFGGRPWVLHCDDAQDPSLSSPPQVLDEAAQQLKELATFGVVDCWQKTESGKTLAQRFNFPGPPVAFAVANGDPPLVLDLEGVTKPWQLRRKVQAHLAASVARINSPEAFRSTCTSRRACVLVGFRTAPALAAALRVFNVVLEDHRGVRAVAVDTSVWKVKLDKALTASRPKGDAEAADVVCIARVSGSRAKGGAFLRLLPGAQLNPESLGAFLGRCAVGKNLIRLTQQPNITVRPPDLPKISSKPAPSPSTSTGSKAGKASRPSSSRKSEFKRRAAKSKGKRKATSDRVGSRAALEEEEPLFSAAPEGDDGWDLNSGEEEVEEEIIDLDAEL
mmetsp:Transcript_71519/g.155370  ORF Transcript_71519/g.155370 Transcript_71519/m.155370 type:complete len:471 (+) Transcript_71519:101-1513(+)